MAEFVVNTENLKQALTKYSRGMTKGYDVIVSELSAPVVTDEVIVVYLKNLKHCVTMLTKEFEILVGTVLKLDWGRRSSAVVKEYQAFMLNLVSAHTFYLKACLKNLVKLFISKIDPKGDDPPVTLEQRQQDERIFLNVHMLLQALIKMVPMAPTVLLPLLMDCFPYMTRSAYCQECYVKNLLQVSQYLAPHRAKILEIIIDKMTKLDVRSPRHAIQEAEDGSDNEEEDMDIIFDMDDMTEKEVITDRKSPVLEDGGPMSHKEADKLDILMDLILSYIQSVCYKGGELDWEATKKLYKELLLVFERIILPTHASAHIQFIMFYICSFKEPLTEGFLDYLWKKVQNPNSQGLFRQASIAYIASLLARAKYITTSTVKACLDLMARWAHTYINQATYTSKPDVDHHGPFYSLCQAIFYVVVFKHKELLAMPKGHQFCQSLNLQTLVTSRLNPLKICLPVIAKTLASVTRMHQLAFCDTIIEKNKRSFLPVANADNSRLTQQNPLDSFFPFDPYMLTRSNKYITPLYQEFEGAVVEEDEDLEEEEHYKEHSESIEISEFTPHSYGKIGMTPTSPTDFLMYGTSPGFKHV